MTKFVNEFKKKIIIISGFTRSGKSALCPIVSSFSNCEMFFTSTIAENIIYLLSLKKISKKSAKFLLNNIFNENIYNLSIGRNLNTRKYDYTRIQKHYLFKNYLNRSKSKEVEKNYEKKNMLNNFPIMFHDAIIESNFLLKNFKGIKLINLIRHPVDLIFSLYKKGYDGKIYKSKKNTVFSIKDKKKIIPYYAMFNKNRFIKLKNGYDKIILILNDLYKLSKNNYRLIKRNKNFIQIKFDDLLINSDVTVKKISNFLRVRKTAHTLNEINKLKKTSIANRESKSEMIFSKINTESKKILKKMIYEYEIN